MEAAEDYDAFKTKLGELGHLLSEIKIGGRQVSTFKLNKPYLWKGREIPCVELPQPKEGSFYPQGLEHVEFVIDKSFDDFIAAYPSLTFDTRGSKKSSNPDIQLKFKGERNISVKFHHKALEEVIKCEQQAGIEEIY